MEEAQRIGATEARNNFFKLLRESFLEKQPFLIEKGKIPMVYIIPVTAKTLTAEPSKEEYTEKLLKIDGDWFSIKDLRKIRRDIEKRLASHAT